MREVEKNDDNGAKRRLEERGAVPRLSSERGRLEMKTKAKTETETETEVGAAAGRDYFPGIFILTERDFLTRCCSSALLFFCSSAFCHCMGVEPAFFFLWGSRSGRRIKR